MPPTENIIPEKPITQSLTLLKKIFALLLPALCMHSAVAQQPVDTSHPVLLHHYLSLEDSSISQSHHTPLGINEGWSIYKDIIFPGTNIKGKLQHNNTFLPGSKLLNCSITGGDAYNNLFFTYTIAKKWMGEQWAFTNATAFEYSMDFYIDSYVDCKTPNLSQLEGLEFIFQQAMPPASFLWGLQWSKSNVWSYWDDTKINRRAKGWVTISGLNACMLYKQWNHISITGHRNEAGLFYDSLLLNGASFPLHSYVSKAYLPPTWAENYLQVGFQINGNKAISRNHKHGTDPVTVLLNNVDLQVKLQKRKSFQYFSAQNIFTFKYFYFILTGLLIKQSNQHL